MKGSLLLIATVLAACGTTALKPEDKLVSGVTSLPPVSVPLAVRCIEKTKIPPMPPRNVDPDATPLQAYFQQKVIIDDYDKYAIDANAALIGCAAAEPKP